MKPGEQRKASGKTVCSLYSLASQMAAGRIEKKRNRLVCDGHPIFCLAKLSFTFSFHANYSCRNSTYSQAGMGFPVITVGLVKVLHLKHDHIPRSIQRLGKDKQVIFMSLSHKGKVVLAETLTQQLDCKYILFVSPTNHPYYFCPQIYRRKYIVV